MSTAEYLISEIQQEAATTRKMLERIPDSKISWKPHEKSMTIGRLGMHIAELHSWVVRCLQTEEFNFDPGSFKPRMPESHAEIITEFEKNLAMTLEVMPTVSDEMLAKQWKFRVGEQLIFDKPRRDVVRSGINHIIHHRGQLSVCLRLLDVPLPNSYGPTADDKK
jgi:uncharacterized damage-inducible protein DinB